VGALGHHAQNFLAVGAIAPIESATLVVGHIQVDTSVVERRPLISSPYFYRISCLSNFFIWLLLWCYVYCAIN